jgi:hypothetical protein
MVSLANFARAREVLGTRAPSARAIAENTPQSSFPELRKDHIDGAARLFASREDLIEGLGVIPGQQLTEVGVAFGDFSEFLLQSLKPEVLVAIDLFELHNTPEVWGRSTAEVFDNGTHLDYYRRRRFARCGDRVQNRSRTER